jgi:hypothetical protein
MPPTMTSYLKDFWFPVFLFLSASALALAAMYAGDNWRRIMLSVAVLLFAVALLVFIWGDPVRGPFANMFRSHDAKEFTLKAGVNCVSPVADLARGIDFSHCASFGPPGREPFEVWIRKTWWSGLVVKVRLKDDQGNVLLVFDNRKLEYGSGSSGDVNHDEYAFEIVDSTKSPQFQIVIAKDYSTIYINARIPRNKDAVLVMRDNRVDFWVPLPEANKPQYKLDRIFKYPSYVHESERE